MNKCVCWQQALGVGYESAACDGIGRQPEEHGKIETAMYVASTLILKYPDDRAFALGRATGEDSSGLFGSIARQPEAYGQIMFQYILFAVDIINGKK